MNYLLVCHPLSYRSKSTAMWQCNRWGIQWPMLPIHPYIQQWDSWPRSILQWGQLSVQRFFRGQKHIWEEHHVRPCRGHGAVPSLRKGKQGKRQFNRIFLPWKSAPISAPELTPHAILIGGSPIKLSPSQKHQMVSFSWCFRHFLGKDFCFWESTCSNLR